MMGKESRGTDIYISNPMGKNQRVRHVAQQVLAQWVLLIPLFWQNDGSKKVTQY